MHSEEIKQKIKNYNIENYGVEWKCMTEEVKNKIKLTKLKSK